MIALIVWIGTASALQDAPAKADWWDAKVAASLDRAPARKADWERLLRGSRPEQRPGLAYLVEYLPSRDLETLSPAALAEDVDLAYQARSEASWGPSLPEAVFLDSVLPNASVTEKRDSMRREFHDRYRPLVKDCKAPGAAALLINKTIFKDYQVTYNTRRLKTDQNSRETIAQGMATCTGLSVMLVEACRSVGVPARVAGISSWPGRGGNHTWAEIWDGDSWHFVGSAEPDEKGLDHAWFAGDAAKAIRSKPENAIFAVTYRATGETFPLAWDPSARINAENVTDRYAGARDKSADQPRLMVEVRRGGERVEADVTALDRETGATCLAGRSMGPRCDVNLHLSTPVTSGRSFLVVAHHAGKTSSREVRIDGDTIVRIDLDQPPPGPSQADVASLLADRFGEPKEKQDRARKILAEVPFDEAFRNLAWQAYKQSPLLKPLKDEFDAKVVKTASRTSPYLWRHVGEKPKQGWALVIAMHGGGGTAKSVNDGQWEGMFKRYYKDHPEAGGYVYLALRAPNDEWNGFYDDAICPLVERLIRQFVAFGDVDPNRVDILGASHGGYGAFVIGPKIPDRFAAVHASASAPTPGETCGENLLNTRFTFMVGEKDTAHGRADRCREFAAQVERWKARDGGHEGGFEWRPGVGHSVPDRDKVAEMIQAGPRNPSPKKVVWVQSDDVLKHCYWVEAPEPAEGGRVEAAIDGNIIKLKVQNQKQLFLWLDQALVDLSRPVTLDVDGGKAQVVTPRPNLETFCRGLEERGDPSLSAPARIAVDLSR